MPFRERKLGTRDLSDMMLLAVGKYRSKDVRASCSRILYPL